MRPDRLLILCGFFVLLAGCGGGGGGSSDPAPPPGDTTPPAVLSVTPSNGASGISTAALWSATFSEAIDCDTLSSGTFGLYAPGDVLVAGSLVCSASNAILTPSAALAAGTCYQARLSTGICDASGNYLTSPVSWNACTAIAETPTSPYVVDAGNVTDTTAHLSGGFTNPAGMTTSVWIEYGVSTAYGQSTAPEIYAAVGNIAIGDDVTGLPAHTTIHFRLATQNSAGTFYSPDRTFTTTFTPEILAGDLNAPTTPLLFGGKLYWEEIYSDRIRSFDPLTATVTTLAVSAINGNNGSMTADSSYLYWSDSQTVWRSGLDGSNVETLRSFPGYSLYKIVAHPTGLYLAAFEGIFRLSLDGSTLETLYAAPGGNPPFNTDIVLDDLYLYWSDYFGGTIKRKALAGGSPVILATNLTDHPRWLQLDATELYFTSDTGISKLPTAGGVVTLVIAHANVADFTKVGGTLYATGGDTVAQVDIAGQTITLLAVGQSSPSRPVVSGGYLYWICGGSQYSLPLGSLRRIALNP